jgi:hypothetical protein
MLIRLFLAGTVSFYCTRVEHAICFRTQRLTTSAITVVPIVTGATAWSCQETGDTFILVFNDSLWMGNIVDHSLINPNQLRHFEIQIQDSP